VSEQQKSEKIEELTQKLSILKEQNNKLDADAKGWAAKRDKLNEQSKSLRTEIIELKNERDKLNEIVKEQKQRRDDTRTKIKEKIEEIRKLRQGTEALAKRKPSRSLVALQKKFKSIEWKIQTTPLDLHEEKGLIEQVKQLETQLNILRKLDHSNQKILELQAELKALETKTSLYHEKLTEIARKSQEMHERMLEKIDELKKLKIQADSMHKLFLEARERARPFQQEIGEILKQIKLLRDEIRQEEEKKKRINDEALREKLEKQAREKLKRGEKLTWEEFQLLAENDTEAQD